MERFGDVPRTAVTLHLGASTFGNRYLSWATFHLALVRFGHRYVWTPFLLGPVKSKGPLHLERRYTWTALHVGAVTFRTCYM